tara:strand:- start:207 stop:1112 length:906 start_codon:yes stop_codon:yes gene_type:complete
MISKFFHYLKIALNFPLILLITRFLSKIGIKNNFLKKLDFLNSPDSKRPTKPIEILIKHMNAAKLPMFKLAKKIPNSDFLEIGCGKHLGLGPVALGLGAKHFIGVDPSLDKNLIYDPEIHKKYFELSLIKNKEFLKTINHFQHLPFILKRNMMMELIPRISLEQKGISNIIKEKNVDICVSISCFEHILDFEFSCKKLSELTHKNTLHLHVVNFSNHLLKEKPFHQLYEMPIHDFRKKWNNNINGLRINDIMKCLHSSGLNLRAITLDNKPELIPQNIHQFWLDNYNIKDLSIRTALITSL